MNEISINLVSQLKNAGKFWYIVNPFETTFEFPHQVPDYYQQVWIPFFFLIVLEQVILTAKNKKKSFRLNDQVTSFSHWIFQESGRVFFRGAEYYAYIKIYENYHRWNLSWNSIWTWYITALGVDFCYYWVHRSNHEVHFLWAHHQVHHSSEEFNLAVGLRQSVLQHWCNFIFYLPLAFFIPPSHFIVHHQFNLIYQLWIHTTIIDDLGPLELIFNTPKHHRVHHGCNLYCLDKNYGGVLIIWDRLFGTFMEEKDEIIYGLVTSPQSFNPLYLQMFYAKAMINKSKGMKSSADKLSVLWKGPSWYPGGPRLGLDKYKINVTSRIKYNVRIPTWQTVYIILHFLIIFYKHLQLYNNEKQDIHNFLGITILNNMFALVAIGLLFDKSQYAGLVELVRCIVYLLYEDCCLNVLIYYIYIISCFIWIFQVVNQMKANFLRL
ncbi:alkylglycerol monooxygenase-like isoform X1 [Vespula pensylvanica]|uniref:alkylglycerol monooxygenase-like isoform X1 n=1 Tax=Vespula pensylvanica TaxID=30213 RepID=UPI001CB9FCBF|nr:alkylglycerol monooxygenase-like isoform X1 [Vespula pensylvanica]XP_043684596.1 alkylglycerol monooxygenase-like isoform X1 [Vespula pensylvanica]XP_043684597.1 alkylglycerol monooxygenase-like isoform X1 [Vespula pensylvanica]